MTFEANATEAERALWRVIQRHAWLLAGAADLLPAVHAWVHDVADRQPAPRPTPRSISHWGMFDDA